jgi:hypothetical protein
MSRMLYRMLVWCSRRRAVTIWSLAVLAAVAIAGRTAAGATVAADNPALRSLPQVFAGGSSDQHPLARVTIVSGLIVSVRETGFILRSEDRRVIGVRTDGATKYRRKGAAVQRSDLSQGQRVTILGRVQPNGRLRARAVSLRGEPASSQDVPAARQVANPR